MHDDDAAHIFMTGQVHMEDAPVGQFDFLDYRIIADLRPAVRIQKCRFFEYRLELVPDVGLSGVKRSAL